MAKVSSNAWSSDLADGADTIVARATPSGRGGLAVVRISGDGTRRLAAVLCPGLDYGRGWTAALTMLRGADGLEIERGVVTPFPEPRSYTGEDMLEIAMHGSPWLVQRLIDAAIRAGARPADPGEFTRRAVANGKLDLVQAEAVNDLVSAQTAWQARMARAQLEGALSREFRDLRDRMTNVLAEVEGALDFGQHELAYERDRARDGVEECLGKIRALVRTAEAGRRVRDGVRVAIVGEPNSGKSTLFNLLVGNERAIVSPHPGTTRDVIEAEVEMAGVPVILQDTAGVGTPADEVEEEGMRRARGVAAEADVVVVLWPADGGVVAVPEDGPGRKVVRVRSKADLGTGGDEEGWLAVSCRTGLGVATLRCELGQMVESGVVDLGGSVAVAERHRIALDRAVGELEGADFEQPELVVEAVRGALTAVGELTGEVATEEVLDRVFAAFCIGK